MKSIPFDRAADYYDATRGFPPGIGDLVADSAARALPPRARGGEIGVGTGRIAKPLLARGMRVTGLDLSPQMLGRLIETLPAGAPAPDLVLADAAAVPLASGAFEAAVSVHVFHLIADWKTALAEARRLLKPGGAFLMGHDWQPDDSPGQVLRRKWREIVLAHGQASAQPGARDFTDVQAELTRLGAALDEWSVGAWTATQSLAHHLETIEHRTWSSTWDIPEDFFAICLAELRAWAAREYGALEREFTTPHRFVWQRFRWEGEAVL